MKNKTFRQKFFCKKTVYVLLLVLFSLVFLLSAGSLISYFWESHENKENYDALSQLIVTAPTAETAGNEETPTGAPAENPTDLVEVKNSNTGKTEKVMRKYAEIYKKNSDLVGWLQIPGTKINYPVMQNAQVADFYLYRNFYKEESRHGCLFAQEQSDPLAPSDNITIYGHNMKDGSMFAGLMDYKKQSFYKDHKKIIFDTIHEEHTYEIVSVFVTTVSIGEGFHYYKFINAADEGEFDTFVKNCKALSLYDTGVSAEYGDKLICLSTCEYNYESVNGRLVVVAKQIS